MFVLTKFISSFMTGKLAKSRNIMHEPGFNSDYCLLWRTLEDTETNQPNDEKFFYPVQMDKLQNI